MITTRRLRVSTLKTWTVRESAGLRDSRIRLSLTVWVEKTNKPFQKTGMVLCVEIDKISILRDDSEFFKSFCRFFSQGTNIHMHTHMCPTSAQFHPEA